LPKDIDPGNHAASGAQRGFAAAVAAALSSVMAETQFLSVIRTWAALAWADGVMQPAEAAALRRLIDAADLADDERAAAHGFLTTQVDLDPSALGDLGEEARRGIYRAACRLAAVDRVVADVERSFLGRLRDALGIAPELAREIEVGILG
jgi:uncharacterized membrane protein YebE (DUF533 family)